MPRVSRGPHLYLKDRGSENDGDAGWYIRDGKSRRSTGCHAGDVEGARRALQAHIGETSRPTFGDGDPSRVGVAAVIALYSIGKIPSLADPVAAIARFQKLTDYFGAKMVSDITPSSCDGYRRWRMHEGRPEPAIRRAGRDPSRDPQFAASWRIYNQR